MNGVCSPPSDIAGVSRCGGRHFFAQKSTLPKDCILGRLLAVQMLNKDGAFDCRRALRLLQSYEKLGAVEKVLTSGPYNCQLWSKAVSCATNELNSGISTHPWELLEHNIELSEVVEKIVRFQVSASAADCSVFCTFQRLPDGDGVDVVGQGDGAFVVPCDDAFYACRISIVDVDPKPPSHVVKYLDDLKKGFDSLRRKG